MSNYDEEKIFDEKEPLFEEKLEEAMTKELPQAVRIWIVPGSQIPHEDIPENAYIHETFIFKPSDSSYIVGLRWNIPGALEGHMDNLAEFSTLEELRKEFPHLFELRGYLMVFG